MNMKNMYKFICLFLAVLMGFTPVVASTSVVYASEVGTASIELTKEEQELASALEFMFDNAVTYGKNGEVLDINFQVIHDKYGYSPELAQVENVIVAEKRMRADAGQCAVVAIQDTLGISAITGLISGGIVGLLRKKAAAEIAKLIAKYTLKNFVPVATGVALLWSFGRCMMF